MMGLEVNQQKTKYMCISRTEMDDLNLKVDNFTFEKLNRFKYLGVNINSTNIMHEEIKNRLTTAKKCYYSLLNLFKSKKTILRIKENPIHHLPKADNNIWV